LSKGHQSLDKCPVLTNSVWNLLQRAIVDYYKIPRMIFNLIDNAYISQNKRSRATVHTSSFGGTMTETTNFYHFLVNILMVL
jgi:Fe-S cluster assembly protein SufD